MRNPFFAVFSICLGLVSEPLWASTYVFVSHSMNDHALKSYFRDAQKYKATLVMRGLVEDSFIKTKQKVEALKISYQIDPTLFEKYQISRVPTIIKVKGDKVHKVVGHISLKEALHIFSEEEKS